MRSRRAFVALLLVVAGLFLAALLTQPYLPQGPFIDTDNIGVQEHYTLSGRVDNSLFVMAQTIELKPGSTVSGDAALLGDVITINGAVTGDLTAVARELILGAESDISGDLIFIGSEAALDGYVGGDLTVSGARLAVYPGARIGGELAACVETISDGRSDPPAIVPCGNLSDLNALHAFGPALSLPAASGTGALALATLSVVVVSLLLSGLAALAVTLFPLHISRIEAAMRARPRSQLVNGLMLLLLLVGLSAGFIVLLAVVPPLGVLLIPVLLILGVAFAVVVLAGLVTLAIVLGDWLLSRVAREHWPPLVAAAVGSLALSLALHLPILFPSGVLVSLAGLALLSAVAAGAALSTRFGTRSTRQSYFVQG